MYSSPAHAQPSQRIIGAAIASAVTFAAIYATITSQPGFGRSLPKPVDFRNSMTSEGAGGAEPEEIMVPDTAIPGSPSPGETTPDLVRNGPDSPRAKTLLPSTDSGGASLEFGRKTSPFLNSGPGVVQPTLKTSARASFPQLSLTAREAGVTTMSYCVTTDGHVRDAKVTVSSGYVRLDAAAIDWLNAREYAPGTVKGAPTEMCGLIDYQWRLGGK